MLPFRLRLGLPSVLSPSGFATKPSINLPFPHTCQFSVHLILLYLLTRMISGEKHTSWNTSSHYMPHLHVSSSLFGQFFYSTLFSNTLSLCSSLNVEFLVPHPEAYAFQYARPLWSAAQFVNVWKCHLQTLVSRIHVLHSCSNESLNNVQVFFYTGSFTVRSRLALGRCFLGMSCRIIQSELDGFRTVRCTKQKEHITVSKKHQLETFIETDWRFLNKFEISDCQRVCWSLAFLTDFFGYLVSLQTNSKTPRLSISKSLRTVCPYSHYHFILRHTASIELNQYLI